MQTRNELIAIVWRCGTPKTVLIVMRTSNGFAHAEEKKSLSEQIEDVKKSRMPKSEKIATLKACGLRDKEISEILRVYVPKGSTAQRFVTTFGVEIECVHAERLALIEAGRANGVDIHSEGYNHTDNSLYFKIVRDGSVSGDVDPNEVVSPILRGNNGMTTLKNAVKALNAVGARVNSTCGLHVHIGAESLSGEQYVNVFKNYQKLESLIDSFMAQSRRNNYYARSLKEHDFSSCHNVSDVRRELSYDRYHKVNAESYERHKTIEFRQHQGSVNFTKISMWVKFCAKLISWSRSNVFTSEVTCIEDIPFLNKQEKDFFESRRNALNV